MNLPWQLIHRQSIDSREQVDQALAILSWINARRCEITAQLKIDKQEAIDAAQRQMQVEIDGVSFAFADIEQALSTMLLAYTEAQREALFQKGKTAEFAHGVIRARKRGASVALAEGETEESVLPRLSDNPHYVRTKQSIDFVSIKSAREKGLLSDEQLAEFGLVYDPGESDNYSICPHKP